MIRTAMVEIINRRTGCGPLVVDDHVVTITRYVLPEKRDPTTCDRGKRTVRTQCATTH